MKKISIIFYLMIPLMIEAQNVPVNFESDGFGADWSWRTFENDNNPPLEIIENPFPDDINRSEKVAKFTARAQGAPFAGCESLHQSDIGSFIIDPENPIITIMVYKSVRSPVGIKLVETSNASLGEIKITNTKINEWEKLEFDFSSRIGITYDQIVIFPDFRNRTKENIIYFDNVTIGDVNQGESPENITFYPNPTQSLITFAESPVNYTLTDLNGKMIMQGYESNLNLSFLTSGLYILRITDSGNKTITKKIMKY
jgi:hypothetical protein